MDKTRAPCANCRTETLHRVLRSHEVFHSAEVEHDPVSDETQEDKDTYEIIQCAGCGRVSFAHSTPYPGFGADDDAEWARIPYDVSYYPSPTSREKPQWLKLDEGFFHFSGVTRAGVPSDLAAMLAEVYEALWGGQHRLALMGVRALLEQVMILKVGDQGSFARNLEVFCERGFVSRVEKDAMNAVLDAGHASMHRMYKPTELDLNTALDIAEGIFAAIYVHENAARELSGRVPRRLPSGKVVPLKPSTKLPNEGSDDNAS